MSCAAIANQQSANLPVSGGIISAGNPKSSTLNTGNDVNVHPSAFNKKWGRKLSRWGPLDNSVNVHTVLFLPAEVKESYG
jgi:hypothetical protein